MEVAYSADDAERIIHSGKLAIVLGAEVDQIELFLGHDPLRLSALEDEARRYLSGTSGAAPRIESLADKIYDAGLRQVTPLHFMDNAFGGTALYCDRIATNVHWLNLWNQGLTTSDDGWPSVVGGPPELEARLQRTQYSINRSWSLLRPPLESAVVKYDDALSSHINARGLTAAGRVLLINLWRRGILVDIDHMSLRTKNAVLALAERLGVPVITSHCCIQEITLDRAEGMPEDWWREWNGQNPSAQPSWPTLRHEGMRSGDDFARIAKLGGIAAPLLKQPAVRKPKTLRHVAADGRELLGTTTGAAAAYLYIVHILGSKAAVAIGSDVNGLSQMPLPSACCPSSTFDFYGRPAHYGMLPDLIWRWRAEGMSEADLAPFFRSAQGYVETWARAESAAARIRHSEAPALVG